MWAVPTLGGSPRRVATGRYLISSPDGTSMFYVKAGTGIYRADKSGLNEELVYNADRDGIKLVGSFLLFPARDAGLSSFSTAS